MVTRCISDSPSGGRWLGAAEPNDDRAPRKDSARRRDFFWGCRLFWREADVMTSMNSRRPLVTESQRDLTELMATMRPRLHRYCARMVGSAFDGEDVVQDALARAAVAYDERVEHPERWLMRIAHNAALDALRRKRRAASRHAEAEMETIADTTSAADARVAAEASLA